MPVQRYTRKIIRYTAVIVTVWNLNGSVLALFFYRIKILMTQIHNKNLFQQVCCNLSSPNTERDPNSMKRWYDNWDAVSPIFKFSAAVLNITVRRVLPQLSVSSCFWISQFCFKQPLIAPSIHCSLYHF